LVDKAREFIDRDLQHVVHGWGFNPVVLVEAHGSIVKDINGKEYIDCISQTAGPVGIGHNHPKVVAALKKYLDSGGILHSFKGAVNIPRVELAEKLSKITPRGLNKIYFTSGGSEAVETAVKGAMRITKKKEVISFQLGYHGGTIACLSLGQPWHREGVPIVPGFRQIAPPYCYRCPWGKIYPECELECSHALERMIKYGSQNDVAAFILEPILGNGGHIFPPSPEYGKIIRETADKYGVLVIADEIQTGLGRTGRMWGSEFIGLKPDILIISKILGGGLPIGAAIFDERLVDKELQTATWHAFTFSGNPLICTAASAAVDVVVEENLPAKAAETGKLMTAKLKKMQEKHSIIGDVRGPGLFIGAELVTNRKTKEPATKEILKILPESYNRGAIFGLDKQPGVGNVVKIKPPLSIPHELADKALDILDSCLTDLEKGKL